ncbi:hypothetical protein [Cytobacillus horneckiae]|uniref:hypothetical protein n=1 Tax=Cytobacillus horneckiae TaxID=549687 RepID=UPI003D9A1461
MAAGRPKSLDGKLTNFNSKITQDHKDTIDAIVKTGPYQSVRELLEDWTDTYLTDNPEAAKKVKDFIALTKGN